MPDITTEHKKHLEHSEPQSDNLAAEFLHSAAYAGIQAPMLGLTQIVDVGAKTDLSSQVQFIDAPRSANSRADWWAQQAGGAVGMIAPFLLARVGVRRLLGTSVAETAIAADARQVKIDSTFGMSVKEAGLTGFVYSALLHPTNSDNTKNLGDFLLAKTAEGAAGAATFMTLTGTGGGLNKLAETSFLKNSTVLRSTVVPLLKNPFTVGVLSGIPAGMVSAEGSALASGRIATSGELKQSVTSMALMGGLLGIGHMAVTKGIDSTLGKTSLEGSSISTDNVPEEKLHRSTDMSPTVVRRVESEVRSVNIKNVTELLRSTEAKPATPDAVQSKFLNIVLGSETANTLSGESYFATRDSNLIANKGSTVFAEAGSKVLAREGSTVVADMKAYVIAERGARVIRNEELETLAKEAHDLEWSSGRKNQNPDARVVRGEQAVAGDGVTMVAEVNAKVVAQKGSTVFAMEGSHVIAEEGSEVLAHYGSRVNAEKASLVKAYEGSSVIAHSGSSVTAGIHSRVIAEAGSSVRALQESETVALSGSHVIAKGSAVVHAMAGADVTAEAHSQVTLYGDVKLKTDPESVVFIANGFSFTTRPGMKYHAQRGSVVFAEENAEVVADEGSEVSAGQGSKVYAYQGGQVFAHEGSFVKANGGSKIYALDGSTVYAKGGSTIMALEGSTIHANAGSYVHADAGSEVFALPGSTVVARDGAIVHADVRAKVTSARAEDLTPLSDEYIKSPVPANLSQADTVKWMQQLSMENRSLVRQFLKTLTFDEGLESGFNFKDPDKIASKAARPSILERKPWHEVSHIRDAFRFKTILDDIGALPNVVKQLQKQDGWQIVKVDLDKAVSPGEWGWRIMAFDLRLPNGQLVEYYLPVEELEKAKKDGNHLLFEKWRNNNVADLTPEQEAERQRDLQASRDKYNAAWQAYLARTGQKDGTIISIINQVQSIASGF
jgi:hypothetical protein